MIRISNIDYRKLLSILSFSLFIIFLGCEKEEISEAEKLNREIYQAMEEIYLWNDYLPDADPAAYNTPEKFLDALRYQPLDKWSFVLTTAEFEQYYEQGEYKGHGFLISLDDDDNIRIGFVYKSTQAYQEGVRRSWIIKKVNGTNATTDNINALLGSSEETITNTILFLDGEGNEKEVELTKETIQINTVLHSEIIEYNSKKIGYMVFQEFIATANEEFASQPIDELIIDLRYNGGGMNTVAEYLASWIAGNQASKVFYKLLHNTKNEFRDVTVNFPANVNALNLTRVFFITTNNSASASELLINGLKPYYDVKLIGTHTAGKPVGMYPMNLPPYIYTLVPISFKYVNSNDEGDFYEGLPVDYPAEDDITHEFGDPQENSLKVTLGAITGEATIKSAHVPSKTRILIPSESGINQFLRAY